MWRKIKSYNSNLPALGHSNSQSHSTSSQYNSAGLQKRTMSTEMSLETREFDHYEYRSSEDCESLILCTKEVIHGFDVINSLSCNF